MLVGCDRAGSYVNLQFVHIIILNKKNLSVKKIDLSAVGKIGPTKRTKERR